jgi:hypothetical protein
MSLSPPVTNFDRADYDQAPPPAEECAYCRRGITAEYYRVDGNLACPTCARVAQSLTPLDSRKTYSRAVLFGIGAAIVGCIAYALVTIMTGWTVGYLAIGVGYLVGKAMKAGSHGLGGRRYQITAAVLTYAAVAMAFVPLALHELAKEGTVRMGTTVRGAGILVGLGLASPFLKLAISPGRGLLGLFIIFISISAAWRLTQRVAFAVEGPFEDAPSLR